MSVPGTTDRPWPAGAVTGIGSMPGTDVVDASALVLGELTGLPHLPELPGRGAGAEMIGRTAALLVDLPVEIVPSGWRIAAHPGRDARRARDFLARDLDALEAAADGYRGALKVQAAGPWTLAASLELASGHKIVSDHGAVRDLAGSLAEGLRAHLGELARRIPAAQVVLQLDEPSLPAVLGGRVSTPSGYGTVRSVQRSVVSDTLRDVLGVAAPGARAVHCCAPDVPLDLLRSAGADALSLDLDHLVTAQLDQLGEAVDAGVSLWLGCLPSVDGPVSAERARSRLLKVWSDLGFPRGDLAWHVVPTPSCGLAGSSPAHAKRVLVALREVGRWLDDLDD